MRTRAYRPEVHGCLEDRSLLSGVAGLSAHPVVLLNRKLDIVIEHMESSFQSFAGDRPSVSHLRARGPLIAELRESLRNVAVMIPFGRVDGLGVKINHILDRMQQDLSARVPNAIRSASDDVIAVTRAEVKARVQAGDVVVR